MTDVSTLTIEERLAILEARTGVAAPLALVPPITIGELTDVPAPGSQIAAQWAQEVSGRVLHRFPNQAAIGAWARRTGREQSRLDTGVEWRRINGAWGRAMPWAGSGVGVAFNAAAPGTYVVNTLNIPADPGPRVASIAVAYRIEVVIGNTARVDLTIDGVPRVLTIADAHGMATGGDPWIAFNASMPIHGVEIPANTAMTVTTVVIVGTGFISRGHPEPWNNTLSATVYPKGY